MTSAIIFEKSGLRITVVGKLSQEELSILEYEVKSTMSGIFKSRAYGGGEK